LCDKCAERLPVSALQEIYNDGIDMRVAEQQGETARAESLKKNIETVYVQNLKEEGAGRKRSKAKSGSPENPAVILGRMAAEKAGVQGMSEKGKKGGCNRALNLTPERRREIARMGALARAKNYQKKRIADNEENA